MEQQLLEEANQSLIYAIEQNDPEQLRVALFVHHERVFENVSECEFNAWHFFEQCTQIVKVYMHVGCVVIGIYVIKFYHYQSIFSGFSGFSGFSWFSVALCIHNASCKPGVP